MMYLITGDVNTDLLVKVMSPRFLHCEVNYFPFIINKYLGGDTWFVVITTVVFYFFNSSHIFINWNSFVKNYPFSEVNSL